MTKKESTIMSALYLLFTIGLGYWAKSLEEQSVPLSMICYALTIICAMLCVSSTLRLTPFWNIIFRVKNMDEDKKEDGNQ